MFSRNTPARKDPDSEEHVPVGSAKNGSARAAATPRVPKPTGPKVRFSLFPASTTKASLTAPASKTGAKLPGTRNVTPANLRLGIMIGAALLLGAVSVYINTSASSAALPEAPAGLSPAQHVQAGPPVAGTPPLTTPGRSTPMPDPVSAALNTPGVDAQGSGKAPADAGSQNAGAASGKAASGTEADRLPVSDQAIPDVFTADETDAAQGHAATSAPPGVGFERRAAVALPGVPLSAAIQTVPVAAAAPLTLQAAAPISPAPVRFPAGLLPPLPAVQQLRALPAPVSAAVAAPGVVLIRPGQSSFGQPSSGQAPVATSAPVTLVGIADGDTPTAILDTPAGQLMVAAGESVEVQGVPYTLSQIKGSTVILTHAHDRLILTETP